MGHARTVLLDGRQLAETRQRLLDSSGAALQAALVTLVAEADRWLQEGPWSVTAKKKTPPSGDMHDYTSQAPYWWPSPSSPDGKPYVQRDGEKNPEVLNYTDRVHAEKVFRSSYSLSLAWFYTGKESYARHAGDVIRTWFITPATRMNPHLNHAQLIPFANTGRHIGIIDFSQWYPSVLDAVAILSTGAPGWTADDTAGFRAWNVDFFAWLTDSPFGRDEAAELNNHGSFAAMQLAAIALFLGDEERTRREVLGIRARLDVTIQPDGAQPQELRRTRSWHYSTFNLLALTRLAAIAQKVGVDLWGYTGPQGQGLAKAVEYVVPAATGATPWRFPELNFRAFAAADIIRAAATAGNEVARRAVEEGRIETPPRDLWPLKSVPEQLDSVKVS